MIFLQKTILLTKIFFFYFPVLFFPVHDIFGGNSKKAVTQILFSDTAGIIKKNARFGGGIYFGFSKLINFDGLNMGINYCYYPVDYFGLGMKYSFFQYKKRVKFEKKIIFREIITRGYYGPSASVKIPLWNKEFNFLSNLSAGFIFYDDFSAALDFNRSVSVVGGAGSFDVGIDFKTPNESHLVFMVSLITAAVNKYEIMNVLDIQTETHPGLIPRMDFSFGIGF